MRCCFRASVTIYLRHFVFLSFDYKNKLNRMFNLDILHRPRVKINTHTHLSCRYVNFYVEILSALICSNYFLLFVFGTEDIVLWGWIINHSYVWGCWFCHSVLSLLPFPAEVNVINAPVKLIIFVEPKQGEWLLKHLFPWWYSVKFIWKSMSKVSHYIF